MKDDNIDFDLFRSTTGPGNDIEFDSFRTTFSDQELVEIALEITVITEQFELHSVIANPTENLFFGFDVL